jgi:hypothetical protein
MHIPVKRVADSAARRDFIGGSDARIIMGQDEKASIRVHRRLKNPHTRLKSVHMWPCGCARVSIRILDMNWTLKKILTNGTPHP